MGKVERLGALVPLTLPVGDVLGDPVPILKRRFLDLGECNQAATLTASLIERIILEDMIATAIWATHLLLLLICPRTLFA